MATTQTDYLETTTLKQILEIPDAAMDQAMGIAYQLHLAGRFAEAETVCKGLIACDHRYWWSHSLHASVLRRLGRLKEALAAVEQGLKYEPRQPKLLLMRAELMVTIARKKSADNASSNVTAAPQSSASRAGTSAAVSPLTV